MRAGEGTGGGFGAEGAPVDDLAGGHTFADETLAALQLDRVHALAETMVRAASQTIRPAQQTHETTTRGRAGEALEVLRRLGPGQARVELGEILGQGGMGLVRVGRQLSMGREVAVKTTRADRRSERATLELLREAWVTGALEHPNILPIYDVGLDDGGAPVIVMRRVEGDDWRALMGDAATVAARFGEDDLLEWNLRVLMQVCSALSCAHERGVIHRDVKPANVMLGAIGEVYLVDWGIAVGLDDDGGGRFPRPEPEGEVVGTPAYMAPEMLAGRSGELGPRTDVYLVGAVLYELLTGAPPHRHAEIGGFVDSVMSSPPRLPSDAVIPAELASICAKSMAAEPAQRYASAEELRLALAGFLRHRSSLRLAQRGRELLVELRELLAVGEAERGGADADDEADAQRLFSEARFAFAAALREWDDNPSARAGLRELLTEMAAEHLHCGELGAAARLLGELDPAPAELLEQLECLRREHDERERERERLERLERDHDARFGQRTRWFAFLLLGVLWSVSPLVIAHFGVFPGSIYGLMLVPGALIVVGGALVWWGRESLMSTGFNRRLALLVAAAFVFQLCLYASAVFAGLSIRAVLVPPFFMWFVIVGIAAIYVDPRLGVPALGYLVAFSYLSMLEVGAIESEPLRRLVLRVMGGAHAVLTVTCLVVWWPRSVFRRLPDEHLRGSG